MTQYFLVHNHPDLNAAAKGIMFRKSTDRSDKNTNNLAFWGDIVEGVPVGSDWVQVGLEFLPTTVNGKHIVVPGELYNVNNSRLCSETLGLSYRNSKNLEDVAAFQETWGETILGFDEGDDWVRVEQYFLPKVVDGRLVLTKQAYDFPTAMSARQRIRDAFVQADVMANAISHKEQAKAASQSRVSFAAGSSMLCENYLLQSEAGDIDADEADLVQARNLRSRKSTNPFDDECELDIEERYSRARKSTNPFVEDVSLEEHEALVAPVSSTAWADYLEGQWLNINFEEIAIERARIRWPNGMLDRISPGPSPSNCFVVLHGGRIVARLSEDGRLYWSDGDIWARRGNGRGTSGSVSPIASATR